MSAPFFQSKAYEMKKEYAPKSIEDSDWSPLFKLAVDNFENEYISL